MDPWYEVAFMAADGQQTVGDFIKQMASQYEGDAPVELRQQIIGAISDLVGEGLVRIHDQPESLPRHLAREDSRPARIAAATSPGGVARKGSRGP